MVTIVLNNGFFLHANIEISYFSSNEGSGNYIFHPVVKVFDFFFPGNQQTLLSCLWLKNTCFMVMGVHLTLISFCLDSADGSKQKWTFCSFALCLKYKYDGMTGFECFTLLKDWRFHWEKNNPVYQTAWNNLAEASIFSFFLHYQFCLGFICNKSERAEMNN